MESSRPAPDAWVTLTGPPSCQRSSQMTVATSTPWTRTTGSRSPRTKMRYSSNTP